jgi:hypothetical protein
MVADYRNALQMPTRWNKGCYWCEILRESTSTLIDEDWGQRRLQDQEIWWCPAKGNGWILVTEVLLAWFLPRGWNRRHAGDPQPFQGLNETTGSRKMAGGHLRWLRMLERKRERLGLSRSIRFSRRSSQGSYRAGSGLHRRHGGGRCWDASGTMRSLRARILAQEVSMDAKTLRSVCGTIFASRLVLISNEEAKSSTASRCPACSGGWRRSRLRDVEGVSKLVSIGWAGGS